MPQQMQLPGDQSFQQKDYFEALEVTNYWLSGGPSQRTLLVSLQTWIRYFEPTEKEKVAATVGLESTSKAIQK